MSPPEGSGRGRPRDESREQAILDAALELLVEVGYERMSMVAVANRARASKATIYRRWSCKDAMVVEALRRRAPAEHVAADTGSLRDDLMVDVRLMARSIVDVGGGLLMGVLRAASESPRLAEVIQEHMVRNKAELCGNALVLAARRGEIPADLDAVPLAEAILSMILTRQMFGVGPLDERFVTHVVDDVAMPLIAGLAARASAASNV
ncbi:TetR/AcrR family transcriptional regulator [Frankia sp. AgPm24]|uniref:TetR/AcrR family transcriptional regulator n=1 Tax=Frankia TaxID=1854 RepID=UPI0013D21FED|nr:MULTISPECIES: TetR/AcrR family transcriptional regulator [Frankia]MCK9925536.1 TetR/AcrR family transcriptional regulator [Frankia sp. AgPm24]